MLDTSNLLRYSLEGGKVHFSVMIKVCVVSNPSVFPNHNVSVADG